MMVCGLTVFLLWASTGVLLYFVNTTEVVRKSDVLLVLAPSGDRLSKAERLMAEGYAGVLAISVPSGSRDADSALCRENREYAIVCFRPDPVTTQGEARSLRTLSQLHGWNSATALTGRSHIPRAQVILERCYKGALSMVADSEDLPLISFVKPRSSWAYRYAYETAAFVKVAFNADC
jgi:uncharacterized SAM-binding protein YcdF (DUF218 family)